MPEAGLPDLVDQVHDLAARVEALEAWRVAHGQGMARRQAQIDAVAENAQRDRWLATLRGRRR